MSYETISVCFESTVCHLRFNRPQAGNSITSNMITECEEVLQQCEERASVVVFSGSPEVFCMGADFAALAGNTKGSQDPQPVYDLWLRMTTGSFITISDVRGKANAGGLGFISASDVVLAEDGAQFSLSELLFGLYPACVLPFLVRRVGFQRANYLVLTTQTIGAKQAYEWGLVDVVDSSGDALLRRHLQRLKRLSKAGIRRYKHYAQTVYPDLKRLKEAAEAGNREVFSDPVNLAGITRYVRSGVFPWEEELAHVN